MNDARRWYRIALADLLVAAVIGCILRTIYIVEIPHLTFKPLLHAHSHTALLGWIFIGLMVFLLDDEPDERTRRRRKALLWTAQGAVIGMLLSFSVQGYGPVSISMSALHMLTSYLLVREAWVATRPWSPVGSRSLARIALIGFILSTLGIWAIGPLLATGQFGTEIYYWSIQFFLHFQFNGWAWFAALALWGRWAELQGAPTPLDRFTVRLWVVGTVLSFALAIAWSERFWYIIAVNSVAVLLQLWAGWRTGIALRRTQVQLMGQAQLWAWRCVTYALVVMGLKVVMQAAVAIPPVAIMAFTIRNYVIGFIHLNMLGAITLMLFAMALLRGWFVSTSTRVRIGLSLFTSGMVLTEALLFLQGTLFWIGWGMMPGYHGLLLGASILLPLGVAILILFPLGRGRSRRLVLERRR
ncbi:MAG: hypothetical protein IT228_13375 [Flavobacteriales bacterium]|nr:hypothetical protein [Flavobacteriales bacterium]MCC6578325.1 hypothetical protein [Flavobacteriales bacterium]NUQ15769.1 hypothetical protein [Flavobacteriales bacterium]